MRKLPHAIGLLLLIFTACSSQIVNVPINPYVNTETSSRRLRKVAVLPFIIPDYLQAKEGGESVSIDITNRLIAELSSRGLYVIADGETVKSAIGRNYPNARDWIFQGNRSDAIHIGREASADAVIIGTIKRYFQGNLTDSEVELEIECVELSSTQIVWSLRELFIGRGGKKYLNETPFSIPPARLAEYAIIDAAEKVRRIQETGGPIDVVNISQRQAMGYGVMGVGGVLTAASFYYYNEANKSYQDYRHATTASDMVRSRNRTQDYDKAWQYLGVAGLAAVGGGLYMVLTDHTSVATADAETRRFVVVPISPRPGFYGVACLARF